MTLLSRRYGSSHFDVSYRDLLEMPVALRSKMVDQLRDWWEEEAPKTPQTSDPDLGSAGGRISS